MPQVEGLEESLAEVGEKLSEAERQLREARQERDNLARSVRQERTKRQEESRSQGQQVHRLTEEISLLKVLLSFLLSYVGKSMFTEKLIKEDGYTVKKIFHTFFLRVDNQARLESVQEESSMWQKQCEDLEERHSLLDATGTPTSSGTASTTASLLAQLAKMQQQVLSSLLLLLGNYVTLCISMLLGNICIVVYVIDYISIMIH